MLKMEHFWEEIWDGMIIGRKAIRAYLTGVRAFEHYFGDQGIRSEAPTQKCPPFDRVKDGPRCEIASIIFMLVIGQKQWTPFPC
jgi:hypothetical protein